MDLWTIWLDALHGALHILSSDVGFGTGLAIVAMTPIFLGMFQLLRESADSARFLWISKPSRTAFPRRKR